MDWALSLPPNTELVKKPLPIAYRSWGEPQGVMFHSDQECQYTSLGFRELLWRHHMKQSLSRRGSCWDNAPTERFFRILKTEWVPEIGYPCCISAKQSITDYMIGYYSVLRPHKHNGELPRNVAAGLLENSKDGGLKYLATTLGVNHSQLNSNRTVWANSV